MNFIVQNDFVFFFQVPVVHLPAVLFRLLIEIGESIISKSPWFAAVFGWPVALFCWRTTQKIDATPTKINQPKHLQLRLPWFWRPKNPVSTCVHCHSAQVLEKPPRFQGSLNGCFTNPAGRTRQIPRIWHEHHRPSCPLWSLEYPRSRCVVKRPSGRGRVHYLP